MSADMIDDRLKLDMIDVKSSVVAVSLGEERQPTFQSKS